MPVHCGCGTLSPLVCLSLCLRWLLGGACILHAEEDAQNPLVRCESDGCVGCGLRTHTYTHTWVILSSEGI